MKHKFYYLYSLTIALCLSGCLSNNNEHSVDSKKPYLIMLSLDGFRWDYEQYAHTPVLDSLAKTGVVADALIPSFPTKTFPNHYTMATGLYPDNHGIVLNSFYADDQKKDYNMKDGSAVTDGNFYQGEPIWSTAELQGVKAATLFWVGSGAEIKGVRPSYWSHYNHSLPFDARIDSVFNWLSLPLAVRPHLIMWYLHQPDEIDHDFGPLSKEAIQVIENLDTYLGKFFAKMRMLPNYNQLNFIITSDHGMSSISKEKEIILDEIIDTTDLLFYNGYNPVLNLKVKEGKLKKVYNELKTVDHLQVWYHDSIPKRLHYGANPRTLDITVVALPNWSIYWSWAKGNSMGAHGYDNSFKDMHAIFYAAGPAFKVDYRSPAFENIHLYPLIAEIMELDPAQTDGNIHSVENILVKKK